MSGAEHRRRRPSPWQAKALAQDLFSVLPGGHRVNYLFQRSLGGLPVSDEQLTADLAYGERHIRNLETHTGLPLARLRLFEFGAGFDLHMPLFFAAAGAAKQLVVDLRPLARPALVRDMAVRLDRRLAGRPGCRPLGEPRRPLDSWLRGRGVVYRAPADARATGLPDASVDGVTSTNTLEHVPPADITRILAEMRRILVPGGIASFQIDYKDHFSYTDASIGPFHFLTIGERRWQRWFNPSIHHQNRLRHSAYRRLFAEAGFEVVAEQLVGGGADDVATVRALPLAEPFCSLPAEDVAIRESFVVLRPVERLR